jgi:hypothetical protein
MPKKKLTKAQVKKIIKRMNYDKAKLGVDKLDHMDSFVPLSLNKLIELDKLFVMAMRKLK